MMLQDPSVNWAAFLSLLGNHLWQSTLCVLLAGLLTLILRHNHARIRYGLWLAASLKFLLPFLLLVIIGAHLRGPRTTARTQTTWYVALEEVSQPFARHATVQVASPVVHPTKFPALPGIIPTLLLPAWFCGFLMILAVWWVRWRRISLATRQAIPLHEGREVEALRQAEYFAGIRRQIGLQASSSILEPGIFGIFRPVLLWPQGISQHLDDAQLRAIMAHEVLHGRRRDNLFAAIHMFVEALFWFHPLVWWLGARLVDERERACDEAVLASGSQRRVYAESILKTCEFCLESPLACVAGVTGAGLKKRVARIMTQGAPYRLNWGTKFLLAAAGTAMIAGPVIFGLINVPPARADASEENDMPLPAFEVASIKPSHSADLGYSISDRLPGRFETRNTTIKYLVQWAYQLPPDQVSGGPDWFHKQSYDVKARIADDQWSKLEKLSQAQRTEQIVLMLRSLLADRCHLVLHHQAREMKIYALVVAKNGPKLHAAGTFSNPNDPANPFRDGKHHMWSFFMTGVSMWEFAHALSDQVGRPVVDQTGLDGRYDLALDRTSESSGGAVAASMGENEDAHAQAPSIFTMIQEQLGLKLEPTKGMADTLIIDRIERPSEN